MYLNGGCLELIQAQKYRMTNAFFPFAVRF
jgi:hypothetical protein